MTLKLALKQVPSLRSGQALRSRADARSLRMTGSLALLYASQQALLTTGHKILERATAQKEVLVGLGMQEQVLGELPAALGEFEQTLEANRAGPKGLPWALRALGRRREHVGASADLKAVLAEIAEQVRLLDGVVKYRFGDNAELMGAWASARNVLGPFKPKAGDQPKAA